MKERFLANENFPRSIVLWLREKGHDVLHAAETLVGNRDDELANVAKSEERIVLTFDRDFGEMMFHQRALQIRGVVLFRLLQLAPRHVIAFMKSFFSSDALLAGYFTVVSPGQYRQTPMTR